MGAADDPVGGSGEVWDRHWAAYDEAARRNPAHRFRRGLIFSALERSAQPGMRILDLGRGQGDFLREARERFPGAELAGVDGSTAGLELARKRAPGAHLLRLDLTGDGPLPAELASFATHMVCSEVLEHLDDPAVALRKAAPALAPGGQLLVTVPGGPRSAFDIHLGHRRHYSPRDLEQLLRGAGYETVEVRGAGRFRPALPAERQPDAARLADVRSVPGGAGLKLGRGDPAEAVELARPDLALATTLKSRSTGAGGVARAKIVSRWQQAPQAGIASLGDAPLALLLPRAQLAWCQSQIGFHLVSVLESVYVVDGRGERCGSDRPDAGRGAQPLHRFVALREMLEAAVDPRELQVDREQHPPAVARSPTSSARTARALHALGEAACVAARHPEALPLQHGAEQREVPGPRLHQRLAHRKLRSHVPLPVRGAMRWPICAQPAGVGQRVCVASVGLHPRRLRVAYIAAKFGSATTTSCPSCSRQRATHSLSVDASMRIFVGALAPNTAANRSRCVRMRRSTISPLSVRMQIRLSTLCTSMPICSMAGLHPLRHTTACTIVGLRPPRRWRPAASSHLSPHLSQRDRARRRRPGGAPQHPQRARPGGPGHRPGAARAVELWHVGRVAGSQAALQQGLAARAGGALRLRRPRSAGVQPHRHGGLNAERQAASPPDLRSLADPDAQRPDPALSLIAVLENREPATAPSPLAAN